MVLASSLLGQANVASGPAPQRYGALGGQRDRWQHPVITLVGKIAALLIQSEADSNSRVAHDVSQRISRGMQRISGSAASGLLSRQHLSTLSSKGVHFASIYRCEI